MYHRQRFDNTAYPHHVLAHFGHTANATAPQVDHLTKPENLALLEKARVVYCTGFFITVSPDSIRTVAKHCADNDKIYAMVRA